MIMKNLFISCLVMFSITSWAQEIPSKEAISSEASQEVSALRLANDLVKYGNKQQLALPLINALQILSDTQFQTGKAVQSGGEVAQKDSGISFDIKSIIESARAYSDGDDKLLSLISEIEKQQNESHRGAVGGPGREVTVVGGNRYIDFTESFVANQIAEVAVSGDGDTDIDIYVYDSNGNLIAKDEDYSDDCYVSWYPRWTGRFIIRIVNRGPIANRFAIVTN